MFKCGNCGFECDRDLNAATNLKNKRSVSLSNCG
nr:zinc ribbon domain-containing protein [Anabaena sp. FACHB-1237]